MQKFKKLICAALAGCLLVPLASCGTEKADVSDIFDSNEKISYCTTYSELSETKTNKTKTWRQGMISGNGLQGVITSGSPYSDTLIYQNMHFILPNQNARTCPDTSDELETVKQSIVEGKDIVDDASYDDVYSFHPGGALRIKQEKQRESDYVRYTDYETAEVGVRYTDKNGTWTRATFTSQADGVTITKIGSSSTGSKVNVTLSYDDISTFANYGDGKEVDLQYKKLANGDQNTLAFIAHYPDYENSELRYGGYATLTYVVCENGLKQVIEDEEIPEDEQFVGTTDPQIYITGADNVYLITVSDRTYDMGAYSDFAAQTDYKLIDTLTEKAKSVYEKYASDGKFSYDAAKEAHLKIYQPLFDAVTLTLGNGTTDESNEAVISGQRRKKEIKSDLAQRAYYAGRYAALCSSGYSTSRLYGMWIGEWNAGWGSKYTMDANVNLQTSALNTENISIAPVGYACFILRQVPDWEENALATHGYTDAIQAPVNTDGDKAVITETCYPYPFRYWNAGTSWMLLPLYETLQTYGDIQIPINGEYDLDKLKSVLSLTEEDLTDADIQALKARGYLNLEEDILLPLLTKSANYWRQMLTPEYYTDASGGIHYTPGKQALADGESYCILPSYSPENNPANYPSPSVANTAIDIAACRSNLEMLLEVQKAVLPNSDTSEWEEMLENLPPYLYDETGALKEFACTAFEENNEHRHLSHLYCAWPLTETQDNPELVKACEQAIANRESENEASHALVHRSLIAARLKDRDSLTDALLNLMNHKIYYNSLMTNHDYDRGSCYCTDFAIGYTGIINESLVYSAPGEIEILPALPTSGFESGSMKGLRARSQALVQDLTWDTQAKTASVTIQSDIAQTIEVSCGLGGEAKSVTLQPGETTTVEFTLS